MKIYIGTDHRGFELKEKLIEWLKENGYDVVDYGAHELNPTDDYPDFIRPVSEAVSKDQESRGVILGGSGEGEAMVANRHRGVRAGVYYGGDIQIIKLLREDNNANILSLGARFLDEDSTLQAVKTFLETSFSGAERHVRRLAKIDNFI